MFLFFIRRVLSTIPSMFAVVTLAFFLIRLAPGSPFSAEGYSGKMAIENLNRKYGLDKPIYQQYFRYLSNIIRGDFGTSLHHFDEKVSERIIETLPISLTLGLSSLSLAVIFGSLLGIMSALGKNSWLDYLCSSIAVLGISVPLFVIAPILVFIFSIKLQLVPTSGWLSEGFNRMILPIISLSLPYFAMIARLMRASMLGILKSDYITTAKSKGLSRHVIVIKHAMKGAFLPVLSYIGPLLASLITGSIVIEQIFRIPGMGHPFVQSALSRDYPLIMGCVITYAIVLMVINIIVDMFYTLLDPRISYGQNISKKGG